MDEPSPSASKHFHPVVEISNGFKHVGVFNNWQIVLQKFNLTAYSGELYVLLGPHGCGKTTVLNVILGLTKLSHGSVEVFGFKPGTEGSGIPGMRVGYTPQSLGLYEDFTVYEIIKYYGNLLGMSRGYINERMAFLDILLSLPAKTTYIRDCPETTKRQLSFAIALLHEPELLILDEPTAGVDPALRKSIWEYLWRMCNTQDNTIIVTTQHALEATKSHRIGIMRNGMLVDEGEPEFLQTSYSLTDIDMVYRRIYMTELSDLKGHQQRVLYDDPEAELHRVHSGGFLYENKSADQFLVEKSRRYHLPWLYLYSICTYPSCCCPCRKIQTLLMKNILFLFRRYIQALLFILIPIMLVVIFGVFIGGRPHGVPVCVINRDSTHEGTRIPFVSEDLLELLMKEDIVLIKHDDIDNATLDVRHGECFGLIVIGSDFSKSFDDEIRFDENCSDDLDDDNLECNFITLHPDETSNLITNHVARTLCIASIQLFTNLMRQNLTERAHIYIYKEGEPIHGIRSPSIARYLVPGFSVLVLSHMSAYLSASNFLYIRNNNLFVRDYLAGVTFVDLVVSGFIANIFLLCIPVGLTLATLNFIYIQTLYWSAGIGICLMVIQMIMGLSFGCCLGVLLKDDASLTLVIMSSCLLNLLTAGILSSTWSLPFRLHKLVLLINPIALAVKNIRLLASFKSLMTRTLIYSIFYPLGWAVISLIICWYMVFTKHGILRSR